MINLHYKNLEPRMSAWGQSRKLARLKGMSVLPSTADVVGPPRHVRFVPEAEMASFDKVRVAEVRLPHAPSQLLLCQP